MGGMKNNTGGPKSNSGAAGGTDLNISERRA
jgi:hypothetical protein